MSTVLTTTLGKHSLLTLQHLLLASVILLTYSPAFFAEPALIDDARLLSSLRNASSINLTELFLHHGGIYYRPLISLSNWVDSVVFQLNPIAMHAVNVILHLANALLIFWIIRTLIKPEQDNRTFLPLLGALIFGLHPITTESVNWISGRTDILAATGLMGATLCILLWQQSRRHYLLLLAGIFFFVGIFTKEVAWGFVLAIPLLLWPRTETPDRLKPAGSRLAHYSIGICISLAFLAATTTLSFWPVLGLAVISWGFADYSIADPDNRSWKRSAMLTALIAVVLITVLLTGLQVCKAIMLKHPFSPTGQALLAMVTDPDKALQATSMAAAFYIKKFFIPLPLSLAITTINPNYIWGGIAVLFLIAFLGAHRTMLSALILTGICLLIPALPLLFGTIAWTPYAERYVYNPAAFWVCAGTLWVSRIPQPNYRKAASVVLVLLIAASSFITYTRSKTWKHNLTLFEDTARKAPHHLESQGIYMITLALNGQFSKAREQHKKIQTSADGPIAMKYDYNYAYLAYWAGMTNEANDVLIASLTRWAPVAGPQTPSFYRDEWQKMYDIHLRLSKDLNVAPRRY